MEQINTKTMVKWFLKIPHKTKKAIKSHIRYTEEYRALLLKWGEPKESNFGNHDDYINFLGDRSLKAEKIVMSRHVHSKYERKVWEAMSFKEIDYGDGSFSYVRNSRYGELYSRYMDRLF